MQLIPTHVKLIRDESTINIPNTKRVIDLTFEISYVSSGNCTEFITDGKANIRKIGEEILNTKINLLKKMELTAQQARELATGQITDAQYQEVLEKIQNQASKGKFELHIYNSVLSDATVQMLRKAGYEVTYAPSVSQQKDGHYHTITW